MSLDPALRTRIESLLSDTLKDLLVPAAKKIQSQIH